MAFSDFTSLTLDQKQALEQLQSRKNVFLSGGAGTGKSTLLRHYLQSLAGAEVAILASTGTAAIMLGGRTFHSFFGLGIMEGGFEQTVERATRHQGITRRLRKTDLVIVDEISMIGALEWEAAEAISKIARKRSEPWGGLRIIAVGDFAQLPPILKREISEFSDLDFEEPKRPWTFLSPVWEKTEFAPAILETIVRSQDQELNEHLAQIRMGEVARETLQFLDQQSLNSAGLALDWQGTRLFARRNQVDLINQQRLAALTSERVEFPTEYYGVAKKIDELKRNAPIPEVLILKVGALIMFRQNDPEQRFANGTLGVLKEVKKDRLRVELMTGKEVDVKKASFSMLDANGEVLATATNYPINLAWACTIHKAQGATLDRVHVNLKGIWEPGQAYVALSRARSFKNMTIEGLAPQVFKVDEVVKRFYKNLI